MRVLTSIVLTAIALTAAACASEEEPGNSRGGPDASVGAPAQTTPTPPAEDPAKCRRLTRRLVGQRLERAESMSRKAGCVLRVVVRDGEQLPVTQDFTKSRINVAVASGRVVEVVGRG